MMDCKTFASLLDVSQEALQPEQKRGMEEHARECEECAARLTLQADCAAMDAREELPDEFTMGWRMKIRREEAMEQKRLRMQGFKKILATAAAVVFVIGGAAVSGMNGWGLPEAAKPNTAIRYTSDTAARSAQTYGFSANSAAGADGAVMLKSVSTSDTVSENAVQTPKIIRTIDYTIKTKAFDADYEKILEMTRQFGGYVESLNASGDVMNGDLRYAYFTLRIPSDKLDDFIGSAKTVGAATAYSEYTQDVSDNYYDIETRLATQEAKMQRLNELLLMATDMEDLIVIENAISETQYQIDRYMGQLKGYDSRITNSYVNVTLRELSDDAVLELPETTLGQRIVNAVKTSVKGMGEFISDAAVFLMAALPWCAALCVIVIVVKVIRRKTKKK
ncbi:MAG: DUF4349 domain-containing protein [Clostridia bacterium]|nr:DUF4349 domain-containing protein [Clostridia bacterium]